MANEVTKKEVNNTGVGTFRTADQKLMTSFITGIEKSLGTLGMKLNDYQLVCARNSFKIAYDLCADNNININNLKDDIQSICEKAAMFNLNAMAIPAECYITPENFNKDGKKPRLQFGIQGDGNDRLLREYGTDIDHVYPFWLVREGDEFTFPSFKGIEIEPPTWQPKGYTKKVIRVVYPIKYNDGTIQYHIAERADVKNNLIAHINRNLQGEYFGFSYYGKAKTEADKIKKEIAQKRADIINTIKDKELEEIIMDSTVQDYISPAWKSPHSRESMIIRKMRNNATKPIPKDMKEAYLFESYMESSEDDEYESPKVDERINKEEAVDIEVSEKAMSESVNEHLLGSNEAVSESKETAQPVTHESVKTSTEPDEAPY